MAGDGVFNPQPIAPLGFQEEREPIWGFFGTGREARLAKGDLQIFYVDSGHANANDLNEGLDPEYPLATIQELIDRALGTSTIVEPALRDYDVVYVSGTVSEDVQTGDYDEMPSYVSIVGAGPSRYSPAWEGDDANTPSLDLRCVGWRVSGFRFYGKTGAACIELHHTDLGGNDIAIRTVIDNCYFDGLTTGLYGIHSHGCYDVWIVDCTFSLWHNGGGTATGLYCAVTPLAIPYRNHIVGCKFYDSDNHMIYPMNGSFIYDCMFQKVGYAYTATQVLQTSAGGNPGDDNVVWRNRMTGNWTVAGGYNAGAADMWGGNWSENIAHANVADNGWTVGVPV